MSNTERGFGNINKLVDLEAKRTNHLFIIGIDEYEYCPKLANAVKDAKDVMNVLLDKYDFAAENATTLFDENATEANILKAFESYAGNLTEQDNLVIYFSGHGEEKKVFNEGYWIPVEAKQGETQQYLPNSLIRTILSSIKTHHTFLISDSCFSGSLFSSGTRSITNRLERDPSRWGLTSGRSEVVSDGKAGENSPFANSLLYALKKNTKALGVQELCAEVLEMTATNAMQTPLGEPLKVEGHRNGQFVFHLKMNEILDWKRAREEGTIESYETFVKLYPESENTEEAKTILLELVEKKAWEDAERVNDIFSYQHYTKQYPNGENYKEALKAIDDLREEKEWQEALYADTIVEYFDYHKKYPNGKYAIDALQKIRILEDDAFWAKAVRQHTLSMYNTYLVKYPKGKHVAEANAAVNQMITEKRKVERKGMVLGSTNASSEIAQIIADEPMAAEMSGRITAEELINEKNNTYWKVAAAATWLVILLAVFAENPAEDIFIVTIIIALLVPYYVAYRYPIKDKKKAIHFLLIAYGLFLFFGLIDIITGGGIFEDYLETALFFLGISIPSILICRYLNKVRYPKVLEKELKKY